VFWNRTIHRSLISAILLLVSSSAAAPANVDTVPVTDAAVIEACGGRALRSGDTLRLMIGNGSPVELRDNINEDARAWAYDRYELAKCADDLGLFVVWVHHYESQTQMLVSQTNGNRAIVAGPIHVSTSKRAFVVVEPFGSGGEYWDFGINVFHRLPNGAWNETWRYRPTDFQGREFVVWEGENTVRISTATWKDGPLVMGHQMVLHVSPVQFLREDGPESILRDEIGRYVDHIPGEQ